MASRSQALVEGIAANALWSSSFVFIKIGLEQIGPLTLAGARYSLAGILLLPWLVAGSRQLTRLTPKLWMKLLLIGVMAYAIGNGSYYVGLHYFTATTLTFLTTLVPLATVVFSLLRRKDVPSSLQVLGLIISIAGYGLFFYAGLSSAEVIGVAIVLMGVLAYSYSTVLTRDVAQEQRIDTLGLTALPLILGGALLLCAAVPIEGIPHLSLGLSGLILLLALANTVAAYMLYNHALRDLTAFEMNSLYNLSPLGTAILAWFVLGETLRPVQVFAMIVVIVGVALAQFRNEPEKM